MNVTLNNGLHILSSQNPCPKCGSHWETTIAGPEDLRQFIKDLKRAPSNNLLKRNDDAEILLIQEFEGLPVANLCCDNCRSYHWSEQIKLSEIMEAVAEWEF